eukprot:6876523-Alexandrium_andersonii.AAC.1
MVRCGMGGVPKPVAGLAAKLRLGSTEVTLGCLEVLWRLLPKETGLSASERGCLPGLGRSS